MFLPNSNSFLLVRSVISKPAIQSGVFGIQESAASLPPASLLSSIRKKFLSNIHSFSLAKRVTTQPTSQLTTPEPVTSILKTSSDSEKRLFLQNAHSFSLTRPATVPSPTQSAIQGLIIQSVAPELEASLLKTSTDSEKRLFLQNARSFSLARPVTIQPITQPTLKGQIVLPAAPELESRLLQPASSDSVKPTIGDKDKRTFLKAAGIAGFSLIASLLIPKKAEALVLGSSPTTGVVGVKDATNTRINPATEETLNEVLKTSDLSFDTGSLNVKVTSLPTAGSSSFSDSGSVDRKGLVDADRHVQVDVLSSALPASASTETTLQTISFGGFKFAIRLATVGDVDYIGEAAIGTATSTASWRIKKVDSATGVIVQWAGTGVFDQVWDNRASLTYS